MTFTEAFQSALRTQGLILSDDEIKRAEFVARSVAVAILEDAAKACENNFRGGSEIQGTRIYFERCARAVRAIIQQVQGEDNDIVR